MNGGQAVTIAAIPLIAGTAGLIAADKDAAQWLPNIPDQVKWSKRVSQIGAIYTLGGVVGGLMLVGKRRTNPEILNTGRSAARALIDATIVNYSLKYMTARERPTRQRRARQVLERGRIVSLRTLDGILGHSGGDRPQQESQVAENHDVYCCYRDQPLALGGPEALSLRHLRRGCYGRADRKFCGKPAR